MRLIDADALKKQMMDHYKTAENGDWILCEEIEDFFDNAPAVDTVKHGKMVTICSVCGWHFDENAYEWSYCPNCGAKMDGGGIL